MSEACCDHPPVDLLVKAAPLGAGSGDGEGEDPRLEALWRLIQAARREWRAWSSELFAALEGLLRGGEGLTDEVVAQVTPLLDEHGATFVWRMTGTGEPPAGAGDRLSWLESTYRVGIAHAREQGLAAAPPARIVAVARDVQLTAQQREGLEYVRARGAVFMRRPVERLVAETGEAVRQARRQLSEQERRLVRRETAAAVVRRDTAEALAVRLRDTVQGTAITNNLDRVARTELMFAHNEGAKAELKARAEASGEPDPRVFKQISPHACVHCRRIWGAAGKPTIYRLSEIEANDAEGGNMGRKAPDWRATTGPIHPNCTCGHLLRYTPGIDEAINAAAKAILDSYK